MRKESLTHKIVRLAIFLALGIVLNIVEKENRTKIMDEITKNVGIKTDGKGICLSLPIEDFVGFDLTE